MKKLMKDLKIVCTSFYTFKITFVFFFFCMFILFTVPVEALEMKAGTAKAVITPTDYKAYVLTGSGKIPDGVNKDIFARVLVLNDGANRLVIVTYDLNCLDVATPILRKRCKDELGLDASHLILLATHNHNGPIQIIPGNFPYGRWLAGRLFDLIKEAIANEQGPVQVFFGSGHGYFVRSTGNAPTDYEIQLLKVMRGNRAVAMLFNQPTHPTQLSSNNIGPGHPGFAMDEVEKRIPGVLAMYADACGGNQFPVPQGITDMAEYRKRIHEVTPALGRKLAEAVLKISEGPMQEVTGPISSKLEVISLPLAPPLSYEEALELAKDIPLDIGFVPYPHPDRGTNWIRNLLKHYKEGIPFPTRTTDRVCTDDGFLVRELDEPREFECRYEEVIVAKIGPMPFVAMQGEVCAPIGMRIKDAFRLSMPIMVFGYMGEHNLYIPTREIVRQDVYQSVVIKIQYASPCGWAPEVEDEMVNGVIRIIKSVLGEE